MAFLPKEKVSRTLWRIWFVLLPWLPLVGCSSFRLPTFAAPAAAIHTPGGASVTQSGDAQTPAGFSSDETIVTITPAPAPTPAGVTESKVAPTVAPVPVVTITTRHETAQAPRAFTPPAPPAPPSASELAHAAGIRWFYVLAALAFLGAVLCWYTGHVLAAIKCAAAGVAFPLLARFFSSTMALSVGIGLLAVATALVVAWYIAERKLTKPT